MPRRALIRVARRTRVCCLLGAGLLALHAGRLRAADITSGPAPALSGIEMQYLDPRVRPQDNFYLYVNGKWLETAEIPADLPAYGAGPKLYEDAQAQLHRLIESAARNPAAETGTEAAKIADLYHSFMDEAALERTGAQPLQAELARIEAARRPQDLAALIAQLQQIGVTVPFGVSVHLDHKQATRYVFDIAQDGLGLPDRDYYLNDGDTTLRLIRRKYQEYVEHGLTLLGEPNAAASAAEIVALETALARAQWSKVELRDPLMAYNRLSPAALSQLAPGFDWQRYLAAAAADKADAVNVSQPGYLKEFARLFASTRPGIWRAYLRWHLLSDYSPYLSSAFVEAHFALYGGVLQGLPEDRPRWQRGVALVDRCLGQALGRRYVEAAFAPPAKLRAEALVQDLLLAYRQDIETLDWMSPETRRQAVTKLDRISVKIGYPSRWRDYSALEIRPDDLVGNVMRADAFEYQRNIAKLGQPVDRGEWESTPQTVNAFYNPERNEIVFPAAVLQAPFFNPAADDAANYGAIGMVIGHEISHAFDDQGARYDGDGNLRDWWTPADHARFIERTRALVAEYSAFVPVPRHHLNGELTLGENIADNAGLAIAYRAYRLSLGGRPAPVIDGLGGDQRFFIGFAQAWREKVRDSFAIEMLQNDPHAVSVDRVLGTLLNFNAFYQAFNVRPGDTMYLPPEQRVSIW